jgi:C-terminal processing protease CtpA/Prc
MSGAKLTHRTIVRFDSAVEIAEDAPHIRVCYLTKKLDYLGYGFNLTADVSKPGQYIGDVEKKSPAEKAGLKLGDRVLEVNDANISHDTHKDAVARIMSVSDEAKLKLVVLDQESGRFYRNKNIVMKKYSINANM